MKTVSSVGRTTPLLGITQEIAGCGINERKALAPPIGETGGCPHAVGLSFPLASVLVPCAWEPRRRSRGKNLILTTEPYHVASQVVLCPRSTELAWGHV